MGVREIDIRLLVWIETRSVMEAITTVSGDTTVITRGCSAIFVQIYFFDNRR